MADIARIAGVSKSTVSRALNDSPLIGTETKDRIRAIAQEHSYRLNAPARRLSLQRSNTVGLVAPSLKPTAAIPDAFMLELMAGIASGLRLNDYDLLVIHISPTDTEWVTRYLEGGRVDGFILISGMWNRTHLDALVAANAPSVRWGADPDVPGRPMVTGDSVAGGRVATSHLVESGRRRIGFLGGPTWSQEVTERYQGYEAALAAGGLALDPALTVYVDSWHDAEARGAAALEELLDRAPDLDAVFCNSDLLAIGALAALQAAGRTVPGDVAVVGYDDIAIAEHTVPPLTTVRQNGPLVGRLLAETLLEYLRTGVVTDVSIPAELVVRGSG
jgi:DNA-binding LacI/PurR family transcriptional regulator